MAFELTTGNGWRFPTISIPSMLEDIEDWIPQANTLHGLSISEDKENMYIEAAVPGVDPKDVEVTMDKGMLWIKAETEKEEKEKKYYRKATKSFSYRVSLPTEVDRKIEPEASCVNGMMRVTFKKLPQTGVKKIAVKTAN